jgi:hypothetical protein
MSDCLLQDLKTISKFFRFFLTHWPNDAYSLRSEFWGKKKRGLRKTMINVSQDSRCYELAVLPLYLFSCLAIGIKKREQPYSMELPSSVLWFALIQSLHGLRNASLCFVIVQNKNYRSSWDLYVVMCQCFTRKPFVRNAMAFGLRLTYRCRPKFNSR